MGSKTIKGIIKGQELAIVGPETSVDEAVKIMHARAIGAVLVAQSGKLVGIFTERDVVRLFSSPGRTEGKILDEVMTPDPNTISPTTSTSEALQIMADGGFRHLPVVENGKLAGIVSRRDFF